MKASLLSPAARGATAQIVFAYEELGLSPEDIASQFDEVVSLEDTYCILSSFSKKYLASLQQRTTDAQTRPGPAPESELDALLEEYRLLSKVADNDLVKERALKFLINEHKGRNDLGAKQLALKERQQGLAEIDVAKRADSFITAMQSIQQKLAAALAGTTGPTLELENK